MSTLDAFNDTMTQFINELVQTFPEEKTFKKYQVTLDIVISTTPKQCLKGYMDSVGPFSGKIMSRDETFFTEDAKDIEFINDLNISKIWTPELSSSTKDAIWQYLQTLFLFGTTISALPQETLNMIENMAKNCIDNVDTNQLSSLMGLLGKNPSKQ